MATPYTSGKNEEGPKKFRGTGGHTSRGVVPSAGNTSGSTSNANTRIGGLKKRMHGANGTKGMPR